MTSETVAKQIRLSKKKIDRLEKKLSAERERHADLVKMFSGIFSFGQEVKEQPEYNRQAIANRVIQLRDEQNLSFTTIASILNTEGLKPRSAKSFSQATVYQLYRKETEKVMTAIAAAGATN